MSKLSVLIRKYRNTNIIKSLVTYLETVDLPGATKKAIIMAIVKGLHTKTGGKWDSQIATAVSGAIEYVLAEVRERADEFNDSPAIPEPTSTAEVKID